MWQATLAALLVTGTGAGGNVRCAAAETDDSLAGELPRIEPLSPAEELATFELAEGFEIELIAAEPLVIDPIAFAFDSRGRLFVVEMRGYSERPDDHLGRIALLQDDDADGRMDRRTTFAEGLSWPTALHPWRDGVLVIEPPRLTFYRDTDDDGVSDRQEVWFDGYGRDNVQGMANSLRWNIDARIHGATSSTGAELRPGNRADADPIELRRRDFAINPLTRSLQPVNGGGQHGLSFNRWGDKFVTSNSDHLQQVLDLDTESLDSRIPLPSLRRSIAVDGPQAEVFRSSPVEPWRIVRTRMRVAGEVPGPIEGGGRPAGYFTGATGTWIVDRERLFGDPAYDTALVCDVGSNLIHRKNLVPDGLFSEGHRIDPGTEWLRSSDIWFRPVQLGDGPDGGVYIADMYREVIEHPRSLPPMIKQHLDLNSGNDRGRIWRVVRSGTGRGPKTTPAERTNSELIQSLDHEIAWQRRTAAQLLAERGAMDAIDELRGAVRQAQRPDARIAAMYLLAQLDQLDAPTLAAAASDDDDRVCQHALQLARQLERLHDVERQAVSAAARPGAYPRLAATLAAQHLSDQSRRRILSQVLRHPLEPLTRAVAASAAGPGIWQILGEQITPAKQQPADSSASLSPAELHAWLQLLLPAARSSTDDSFTAGFTRFATHVADAGSAAHRGAFLDALAESETVARYRRLAELIPAATRDELLQDVEAQVANLSDEPTGGEESVAWITRARLLPAAVAMQYLEPLVSPEHANEVQIAAIESLLWASGSDATQRILSGWRGFTPPVAEAALYAILRSPESLELLADALAAEHVRAAEIPLPVQQQLKQRAPKKLAARFDSLLQQVRSDRSAVIEDFQQRMAAVSNDGSGKATFDRHCAACHVRNKTGHAVGPPLETTRDKTASQLLVSILDPNREIDPKYLSYAVLTSDGRQINGVVHDATGAQIVIRESGGKETTIPRSDIEQIANSGQSLMPAGFEEQITPQQMLSLIEYLQQ